jgi:putative transport protein
MLFVYRTAVPPAARGGSEPAPGLPALPATSRPWLGRVVLRVDVDVLCGLVAGMQTQPAVLAFAVEPARSDAPSTGYASVYPIATIVKIVLAQVLLSS